MTVCIILGIFCIAAGVYELMRYLRLGTAGVFFRFDLSFSICSILAGILFLLHPYGAATLLPIAAGLYIVTRSILDIQTSIEVRRAHVGNWTAILLFGVIEMIFAVSLLLNPFEGAKALMVFLGIVLILGSVRNFSLVCCISRAVKASRNDDVIDVEWKSLD